MNFWGSLGSGSLSWCEIAVGAGLAFLFGLPVRAVLWGGRTPTRVCRHIPNAGQSGPSCPNSCSLGSRAGVCQNGPKPLGMLQPGVGKAPGMACRDGGCGQPKG